MDVLGLQSRRVGSSSIKMFWFQFTFLLLFSHKISRVSSVEEDYNILSDYEDDANGEKWGEFSEAKRHVGSLAAYSGVRNFGRTGRTNGGMQIKDSDSITTNEERNAEEEIEAKGKRFLGSMARSGWFPRQFRGFMEPQWEKRHIGAIARLGWGPYNQRNRMDGESFKRNVQSLRRNKVRWGGGEDNS